MAIVVGLIVFYIFLGGKLKLSRMDNQFVDKFINVQSGENYFIRVLMQTEKNA